MILVITLLILLCLLILAVAAIVIFYIQNPIEEEGKGKAQDNIKQLTTPTTTNPTKTQPNSFESFQNTIKMEKKYLIIYRK